MGPGSAIRRWNYILQLYRLDSLCNGLDSARIGFADGHGQVSWGSVAKQPFLNVNGSDGRGLAASIFLVTDRVFGFFFQGEGESLSFHDGLPPS